MKSGDTTMSLRKRYQVLYVDDEDQALKYFRLALSDDFNIICASNAKQALKLLDENSENIAVIISDQRMPERTGVDLLATVKKEHPETLRIITTAYANLEDTIEAVNTGEIFRYILKPWKIDGLKTDLDDAIGIYTENQFKKTLLAGKRETIISSASSIAHEMRTPLLGIHLSVENIQTHLPRLISSYRELHKMSPGLDSPNEQITTPLTQSQLKNLESSIEVIFRTINQSNKLVDLMLENASNSNLEAIELSSLDAKLSLLEAVEQYPFSSGEAELINIDTKQNFTFQGATVLFPYLIFNLMKNALRAIQSKGSGEIFISLGTSDNENTLKLKDTGVGIPETMVKNIFNDFYSSDSDGRTQGVGIGLSYCRNVMRRFGGEIECRSVFNEYTEFILHFPLDNKNTTKQTANT